MRKLTSQALTPRLTRREMLQATAGLGVSLALNKTGTVWAAETAGLLSLDLGGDMWTLQEEGKSETVPARVPGSTYTNLLNAEKIPDPFFGENNDKVQWVAEKSWFFERSFEAPRDLHDKQHVELVCHGLDTLATVWLNGRQVGAADNMFRSWTFDIKPHLRRGTNHLRIRFDPLTPYVEKQRAAYKQRYGIDLPNQRSWVRKGPYMWGWDWCRPILTQGIWKKIEVLGYDARIADLGVLQSHQPDGSVQLDIHAAVAGEPAGAGVKTQVLLAGNVVAEAAGPVTKGAAVLHATVPKPELWWPNGMGDQPLYTVTAQLTDSKGQSAGSASRRIGLRKVEVLPPKDGVAMHLRVNGVPVFAKGADWIPADNMPTRVTPEILRYYMTKAVECNFNFIRLWGGGYYEEDELFDLCDELGLMLQFEFKFANASYPVNDKPWMDNLRAEIEDQTRRCRNHPSIVIWSGNNEIKYFEGYDQLFKDVIGGIVERLVPGVFYEVGSGAHGSGDIHTWGVWHGNRPVESYRDIEGFVTEFGMQSTPVPMTVHAFTDPAGRQSVQSPVMSYHELDGSNHGIAIIMGYTEANFGKAPDNFDDTLWLTDINQAWAMRYGVEHWRRGMPRSMAAAIWQYNDCWLCSTWAMIDYYRRWKAVLYQSKHFFAPILVSGLPDAKTGQAGIYVTSDRQQDLSGQLCWSVTNLAGEVLRQGTKQIDIPARTSRQAESLDLSDPVKAYGEANLLVWPEVIVEGRTVARNTLLFGRPKDLKLKQPKLSVRSSGGEQRYDVVIEADVPALWVWANVKDADAEYSGNFVDLRPGRAAGIQVTLDKPMTPFEFRSRLEVRSVYDVAPEMRG
ncbi:MAG: glycoside hydrolase family 2 protein [Acidobacteriota bacterium]|nr:glycoside hydrolase family 2 protein [Acidobacteriota bacterium]